MDPQGWTPFRAFFFHRRWLPHAPSVLRTTLPRGQAPLRGGDGLAGEVRATAGAAMRRWGGRKVYGVAWVRGFGIETGRSHPRHEESTCPTTHGTGILAYIDPFASTSFGPSCLNGSQQRNWWRRSKMRSFFGCFGPGSEPEPEPELQICLLGFHYYYLSILSNSEPEPGPLKNQNHDSKSQDPSSP